MMRRLHRRAQNQRWRRDEVDILWKIDSLQFGESILARNQGNFGAVLSSEQRERMKNHIEELTKLTKVAEATSSVDISKSNC